MKKILSYYIKAVFLIQTGFFIYTFLGLGVITQAAGDIFAEYTFYYGAGLFLLALALYPVLSLSLKKLPAALLYGLFDLGTIALSLVWISITLGTIYRFQTFWGFFTLLTALDSLGFLAIPFFRQYLPDEEGFLSGKKRLQKAVLILTALLGLNAVLAFGGYGHTIAVEPNRNDMKLSFWGSWDYDSYSPALLEKMTGRGYSLYSFTSVEAFRENPDKLVEALHKWEEIGVSNYLTVGIRDTAQFKADILEIAEYLKDQNIPNLKGFTADIEWAHSSIEAYKTNEAEGDFIGLARDMFALGDTKEQWQMQVDDYTDLNNRLHGLGFENHMVGMFWELDDHADGDESMERFFQMAAVPADNYDRFNYMIYRWDYSVRESPYFTYYYLREMQNRFAMEETSVSLGVTGYYPLDTLEGLIEDIRICQYMGTPEVILFILQPQEGNFPHHYEEGLHSFDLIEEALDTPKEIRIPYTRSLFFENIIVKMIDLYI